MEGVGARLGRSSTRYGPAVVFTGRVRKWKKRWVHVSPDQSGNSKHGSANGGSHHSQIRNLNNGNGNANGNGNGNGNGSHLLFYKWTPVSQSQSNNVNGNDASSAVEDPPIPKRRFKFVPIAVLEEQKNEDLENEKNDDDDDNESKPRDTDHTGAELNSKNNSLNEKPDINDLPIEENQENIQSVRQDLNESTLDLSLG